VIHRPHSNNLIHLSLSVWIGCVSGLPSGFLPLGVFQPGEEPAQTRKPGG